LRHVNGHASVANTAALNAAGVGEATPDPKGGTYVRDAGGRLTGVLLERAHEHVSDAAPAPSLQQRVEAVMSAADAMARHGVTCATDMMTGYSDLLGEMEAYKLAAERGAKIRLRLFLQWSPLFGARAAEQERREALASEMDPATCRVAGAKIFADGAISAGTAAIHGTFKSGGNGSLIYDPARLAAMVRTAHEAGWRVSVHSIGDRATDAVMDAFEAAGDCRRHRLEHAMLLSDAQVHRIARSGVHVTMQPEFLKKLGHAYFKQLGPEAAATLKRARTLLDAGVRLSFNSDRPIVSGDPWDGILTAVSRPVGFDPAENVTLDEAVALYAQGGADANDDSGEMGAIRAGCLADFQVYREGIAPAKKPDPTAVFKGGELTFGEGSYWGEHAPAASR
jgi:predicted amidohydrolase YtcJ